MAAYISIFPRKNTFILSMFLKHRRQPTTLCYNFTRMFNIRNLPLLRNKTSGANFMSKNKFENGRALSVKCTVRPCVPCLFTFISSRSVLHRTVNAARSLHFVACGRQLHRLSSSTSSFTQHDTISGQLSLRGLCSVAPRCCWNCNTPRTTTTNEGAATFFCENCNIIQPVADELTYFQIMQSEQRYDIDAGQLTQTFRSLQRQLHPDKFSTAKDQKEQAYSADQSSSVNKAYSTLLKPLSRGLYLLELHGQSIEEGDSSVDPEFLMEVMETNEELADAEDQDTIRHIRAENNEKLTNLMQKLTEAFSNKNIETAREILVHLKYYANIEDKAKDKLGTDA